MKLDVCKLDEKADKMIGGLRTMTSGRGQFSMELSHYAICQCNVSDDVIAKAKAKDEAFRVGKQLERCQQSASHFINCRLAKDSV
jgi:hypothetical protein